METNTEDNPDVEIAMILKTSVKTMSQATIKNAQNKLKNKLREKKL